MLKEFTLSEAQHLGRAVGAVDETFQMDEQSFRTFYDRTARPLWSYLYRSSGNAALADDLMQESYFRLLRVRFPEMNQEYMKNYLFRIGTNLLRDHWRHSKVEPAALAAPEEVEQPRAAAARARRADVSNAVGCDERDEGFEAARKGIAVARVRGGLQPQGDCRNDRTQGAEYPVAIISSAQ